MNFGDTLILATSDLRCDSRKEAQHPRIPFCISSKYVSMCMRLESQPSLGGGHVDPEALAQPGCPSGAVSSGP